VWRAFFDLGVIPPDVRGGDWPMFPDTGWSTDASGKNAQFLLEVRTRLAQLYGAGAITLKDVWRFSIAPNILGQHLARRLTAAGKDWQAPRRFARALLGADFDLGLDLQRLRERAARRRVKRVKRAKKRVKRAKQA
jgi:hypothetical protein